MESHPGEAVCVCPDAIICDRHSMRLPEKNFPLTFNAMYEGIYTRAMQQLIVKGRINKFHATTVHIPF